MKHKLQWILLGVFLIELILVIVLWFCGFRITYSPTLENNWEAISACAAWAAVFVSGLAIWYAIQVPKKIAEEQNKISLFEKRYEFYIAFCKCVSFAETIKDINDNHAARKHFYLMLNDNLTVCDDEAINSIITPMQMKLVSTLEQGTYLFNIEMDEILQAVLNDMVVVLSYKISEEEFIESRDRFILSSKKAKDLLTDKIRAELTLN